MADAGFIYVMKNSHVHILEPEDQERLRANHKSYRSQSSPPRICRRQSLSLESFKSMPNGTDYIKDVKAIELREALHDSICFKEVAVGQREDMDHKSTPGPLIFGSECVQKKSDSRSIGQPSTQDMLYSARSSISGCHKKSGRIAGEVLSAMDLLPEMHSSVHDCYCYEGTDDGFDDDYMPAHDSFKDHTQCDVLEQAPATQQDGSLLEGATATQQALEVSTVADGPVSKMMCNIPFQATSAEVHDFINEKGFADKYDCLSMPRPKAGPKSASMGYAFIALKNAKIASEFLSFFQNLPFPNSVKLVYTNVALRQGSVQVSEYHAHRLSQYRSRRRGNQ